MFVRLLLEVRDDHRDAPRASRFVRHDEHLCEMFGTCVSKPYGNRRGY